MSDLYLSASDSRLGFESPITFAVSGTDDFAAHNATILDDLILEGIFFQKPHNTSLTIALTVGSSGAEVALVSSLAANNESSGFRASKVPLPKGSRLVISSTGAHNGHKVVSLVFRTARSGV